MQTVTEKPTTADTAPPHGRVPIELVGRPGDASLELRGSILIYHRRSFVTAASVFIPVEWLRVENERRRDLRRLYHATLSLMIAVLFLLPLVYILRVLPPLTAVDTAMAVAFGGLSLVTAAAGIGGLVWFALPRTLTRLRVQGQPYHMHITFWRMPGRNARLDRLIDAARAAQADVEETMPYPVRMNHIWRRPRPVRMALLKGFAVSAVLYAVLLVLEMLRLQGIVPPFPRAAFAIVLLPPLVNLAMLAWQRFLGLAEPPGFRRAVRDYHAGRLAEAEHWLDSVLRTTPDYPAAQLLMVQVCAEQYLFDKAFRYCDKLSEEHPALAQRLQGSLWEIKRIYGRMEA